MGGIDDETRLVTAEDAAAPDDFGVSEGTVLSHTYVVEKLLARGGMGAVYRARHVKLGTEHAIKIMLPELAQDSRVIDLFTREAAVLRNVRSEAVVGYDGVVCDEDGRLYLIMEFADGPSLKSRLKDGPLTPDEVLVLRDRLAMGLGAAHEKGVIHRDMSPDNVILPGGRLEDAKIIDFGIAKLEDPEVQTVLGSDFAGKYSYASPEQLGMHGGHVDGRSDIYSTGLVLAAAAIGEPLPMGRSHIDVIEARRSVPDLSAVPESLREEIAWMLQPNPDDRPASMSELVPHLAIPTTVRTAPQAPVPTRPKPEPRGGGRTGLVIGIVLVVLVALAGGGYYGYQVYLEQQAEEERRLAEEERRRLAEEERQRVEAEDRRIRAGIETVTSQFQCAGLAGTLGDNRDVTVSGFVSSDTDVSKLVAELSAIPGVRRVNPAVTVRPWPFCAAISVVETQAGLEPGLPGKPAIRPNNPSLIYFEGNNLVIRATSTRLYDGYLYIDFIDKQGSVYHLFPTGQRSDNSVFAGQEITVGGGPGGNPGELALSISRPFGTDMIVAISSPEPLFAEPREFEEPASSYLQVLSEALTAVSGGEKRPVASYVFITSREP